MENPKLVAVNGNVIVQTELSEREAESGIRHDSTFSPDKYNARSGVVIDVPRRSDLMGWPNEVEVGDTVFFHYLTINKARREKALHKAVEGYYLPVRHSMIHARIDKDGEIHAINNSVLIEPMENPNHKYENISFIAPDNVLKSKTAYRGRVMYISENFTPYKDKFKVGDVVVFRKYSDHPLEYGSVKTKIKSKLARLKDRSYIFGVEQ